MNEEQKLRLLDNSERLERTGHHLTTGYRIILETEEIGSQVLQDLHAQRETIQKSRSRVRVLFLSLSSRCSLSIRFSY
jgi:vesicle transport through interaction with t-SNAREs protein 1